MFWVKYETEVWRASDVKKCNRMVYWMRMVSPGRANRYRSKTLVDGWKEDELYNAKYLVFAVIANSLTGRPLNVVTWTPAKRRLSIG